MCWSSVEGLDGTYPPTPANTSPETLESCLDGGQQMPLESPDTLVPPLHQKLASGSELGGNGSQQRAAVCPQRAEVTGGREQGKHQLQEPGIASSVGSGSAPPGSPLSSLRMLPRPPGLSN